MGIKYNKLIRKYKNTNKTDYPMQLQEWVMGDYHMKGKSAGKPSSDGNKKLNQATK
jgi:hypothetical protein